MSMYALIVELVCYPAHRQAVVERALKHAELVRKEPGCIQFDVLLSTEDSELVFLYEAYRSYEAWQEHDGMYYMSGFRKDIEPFLKGRRRVVCKVASLSMDAE